MARKDRPALFLFTVATVMVLFVGHIFYLNYLYDPWWHFDGNKSGGDKYTFNDREAKINKFHHEGEDFDCVLFGSSRALTFNEHRIKDYKCFNFALSDARLGTMLKYAEYFRRSVPNPKLVIVATDERCFPDGKGACTGDPERYLEPTIDRPEPWYKSYFSVDALRFSKRLAANHRVVIGRDKNWKPKVHESRAKKIYRFEKMWGYTEKEFENIKAGEPPRKTYSSRCVKLNEGFRMLFPESRIIAYVPPVTPDLVVNWYAQGNLEDILKAFYESSKFFDRYLDFSVPSSFTLNPALTWDGTHFKPRASHYIIRQLIDEKQGVALNVLNLSFEQYKEIYLKRIADLVAEHVPDQLDERLASLAGSREWINHPLRPDQVGTALSASLSK